MAQQRPLPKQPAIKFDGVADLLRQGTRHACWRTVPKGPNAKPGKPPFNPRTGKYASSTDPNTWCSFDECVKAVKSGEYEGISFFLSDDDDIIGIDLDNCRNPNNKAISPWAQRIIEAINSYTEVSPSGKGIRIFLRGTFSGGRRPTEGIEVYGSNKALSITGRRLRNYPATIEERPNWRDAFPPGTFDREPFSIAGSHGILNGWEPGEGSTSAPRRSTLFRQFPQAKRLYEGPNSDQSRAEFGLAKDALKAGWSLDETCNLLVDARRNVGGEPKHKGYYESTVENATAAIHTDAAEQSIVALTGDQPQKKSPRPVPRHKSKPAESQAAIPSVVSALAECKAAFNRCLYLEDDSIVDLLLAMTAGNSFCTDPLWLYLIAPPSWGKTEALQGILHRPDVFAISDLTPAALISGYVNPANRDEDMSLLPHLDGKLVVVKDFTLILSKPKDTRDQLYGILRDCYDGSSTRITGTKGRQTYESRFNMIAACTPAIDNEFARNAPLGERFLSYRMVVEDTEALTRQALANAHSETESRQILQASVDKVLQAIDAAFADTVPDVTEAVRNQTAKLATLLAHIRTHIRRERDHLVAIPQPEAGGRVGKQLLRLGQSVALVHGNQSIGDSEFALMRRVALDSIPSIRRSLLLSLVDSRTPQNDKYFATRLRGYSATARRQLEDLYAIGIVEKPTDRNGKSLGYLLSPKYRKLCEDIGITAKT